MQGREETSELIAVLFLCLKSCLLCLDVGNNFQYIIVVTRSMGTIWGALCWWTKRGQKVKEGSQHSSDNSEGYQKIRRRLLKTHSFNKLNSVI